MASFLQIKDSGNVAVTFESNGKTFRFISIYDGMQLTYKLTESFDGREREITNTTLHHSDDIHSIEDSLRR